MSAEKPGISPQREALGPYLHPDHWDGHTFAQGDMTTAGMWRHIPWGLQSFTKQTLADYLNEPTGRIPLETYQSGDVFNPNNYHSGTVVAYRLEVLFNAYLKSDIDLEGTEAAPIISLLPSGKELRRHTYFKETLAEDEGGGSIEYWDSSLWGVVGRRRKDGAASLVQVYPSCIEGVAPNTIVTKTHNQESRPLAIGAVKHWRKFGYESISRINVLEVCANGTPDKQPRSVFGAFRRFATASGMS